MSFLNKNFIFFVVLFSISACSEPHSGTKILNGAAYIELPDGYKEMSAEMRKLKYPDNTPPEAYATEDTTASFVFKLTANLVSESDLPKMADVMKMQYAGFNPEISQVDVDSKKAYIVKVTTPTTDGNINNIMMLVSMNGELLIASFNTAEKNSDKYYMSGEKALMSIKWKQ